MWEYLSQFGEDMWETVSEGTVAVVDSVVNAQVQTQQEAAKDPEVLNQLEPEKAQRTDGSTIVATPPAPKAWVTGVDNTVLLVGGALVLGLVLLARGGK